MPKVQRSPPSTPGTSSAPQGETGAVMQSTSFVNTNPRNKVACSTTTNTVCDPPTSILAAIDDLRRDMNERFNAQQGNFDQFNKTLLQLRAEVSDLNNKFITIKKDFDELSNTVVFLSGLQDEQVVINSESREKLRKLENENSSLMCTVSELNARVGQMEQLSRDCNVEVQCVPESRTENVVEVLNKLLHSVSCELPASSVLSVHRVAKLNSDSDRPRSIVAKLATPLLRDSVLAAVTKFNKSKKNKDDKLNSLHLGFASKQPIYVSEHLTPSNKKLHAAARKFAKEKDYLYVWIRNGRIFIRKNNESPFIVVKSEAFLKTIT